MPKRDDDTPGDDEPDFVSQLEALFGAVLDKAKGDPAFAKKIAHAVVDPEKFSRRALYATDWRSEAPNIDVAAVYDEYGADGLRMELRGLKRRQIYALVRARDLNPARTSNLNKTQLIEHIVRTVQGESTPVKSIFDY